MTILELELQKAKGAYIRDAWHVRGGVRNDGFMLDGGI